MTDEDRIADNVVAKYQTPVFVTEYSDHIEFRIWSFLRVLPSDDTLIVTIMISLLMLERMRWHRRLGQPKLFVNSWIVG